MRPRSLFSSSFLLARFYMHNPIFNICWGSLIRMRNYNAICMSSSIYSINYISLCSIGHYQHTPDFSSFHSFSLAPASRLLSSSTLHRLGFLNLLSVCRRSLCVAAVLPWGYGDDRRGQTFLPVTVIGERSQTPAQPRPLCLRALRPAW